ncbi:type 1 glutamine amidotransferase family protein [Ekhidna sp.]|uniref:type 1 glutamine amidotransferase family protein n=1 Tax=Ekhidna sp. TaxID=2608089 RepID=UPI00329A248B
MENVKIFVFLFDGFSDWEIAYLTPEINRSELGDLIYFSKDGELVKSIGGLTVVPDETISGINPEDVDLMVLPGGTYWENGGDKQIAFLIKELVALNKPVAAICAATTFLGQLGLLNEVAHTSNDLNYLKSIAPSYTGETHYRDALAISDNNVVTANGIAPIEFAQEVFKMMGFFNEEDLHKWYQLYKDGIWTD